MGMNQSRIMFTIGAGVTTAGLVWYLVFGPNGVKIRRKRQRKPIMGLKNAGATCFLNSLLQALSSCNHFTDWLAHKDDANKADFPPRVPNTYSSGFQYPLIAVVYRALLVINREIENDDDLFTTKVPGDIISAIRRQGHSFQITEEQDTFEFFQFLISVLSKEVESSIRRQQIGSVDCIIDEEDTSEVSGELISYSEIESASLDPPAPGPVNIGVGAIHPESIANIDSWAVINDPNNDIFRIVSNRKLVVACTPRSSPHPSFRGMTWTSLQCLVCMNKTPPKLEAFDTLSLVLPAEKVGDEYGLMSLIGNFFKPTIVTQVDCKGCTRIHGRPAKSAFSKKTFMARMPSTLLLHISRTCWSGTLSKRSEHVRFQEMLNLSVLERHYDCYRPENGMDGDTAAQNSETRLARFRNSQYRLVAVISHIGDPEFGHFMTFRRGPSETRYVGSNEWFCVSDEMVHSVSLTDVLSTRAYMLFYEKLRLRE